MFCATFTYYPHQSPLYTMFQTPRVHVFIPILQSFWKKNILIIKITILIIPIRFIYMGAEVPVTFCAHMFICP